MQALGCGRMAWVKHVNPTAMAPVIVLVMHMRVSVGTALGFKFCLHFTDLPPQTNDHGAQHMIGQQTQTICANLQWHVAITDVIGDASEFARPTSAHFEQGFSGRFDRKNPAIIELQSRSMAQ